jgi:hypothetical protein
MTHMTHMKLVFRTCCGAPGGFRLHATRKAAIQGWQLSESLRGLLITLCHIRYSPIGASSKLVSLLKNALAGGKKADRAT